MRNLFLIFMLSLITMACSNVPAGHVGIKVYLLGGSKGVDHEVLGVGRYWIGVNEELYLFPTYQQNYNWTVSKDEGKAMDESLTFQSKEGMSINADVGISYAIDAAKVPLIFQKYRKGVDELTDVVLRNAVRDSIVKLSSVLTVEEIYSTKKAQLMSDIKKDVQAQYADLGIKIENIFLIGEMRLPKTIVAALNSKIEAIQKSQQIENELAAAKAEAAKKVAQAEGEAKSKLALARAEAEANSLKLKTLTAELIQYEAILKWDGKLPTMMGSSAVPFINVGGK